MAVIPVDIAGRPYEVRVGAGLLAELVENCRGKLRKPGVAIVTDANVHKAWGEVVQAALHAGGHELHWRVLPPGEATKSWAELSAMVDWLLELGVERGDHIVALGGGVIGDLTGFAAAVLKRGCHFIQLPTTLLAQVDSSVGGKTAIDIPQGKNLVGAFHPPRAVAIDTATLRTLPPRELRAGLAEVVKYGAIIDAGFIDWLDAHADALLAMDATALSAAIARSCRHKAAITERDPLEHGERALLNFGHTFAHAIEAEQGYGAGLNHGEAVAVGMVLAAKLSARLGMATMDDATRLTTLLERLGLPVRIPGGLDADALLARMRLDKKTAADGLRFILWDGIGRARIVAGVDESAVLQLLRED